MKSTSLTSPALAGGFFTPGATWEARLGYNEVRNSHETHTRVVSHLFNIPWDVNRFPEWPFPMQ